MDDQTHKKIAMKVLEINVNDIGMGGVFSLVRNVIRMKKEDVQIDIATLEPFEKQENEAELRQLGTEIYYVGYEGNKLLKQFVCFFNMYTLVKRRRYGCVHIHSDVANKLFVSGLACKLAGVRKIILHSHASDVDGRHRWAKRIYHKGCRRFLKSIGTDFLSCSDLAASWMFPNVSSDRIIMINNGVDLCKFRYNIDTRNTVREELLLSGKFVIGHIGRFTYQKNHEFLIRVFSEVVKTNRDARLLLVGEGELEEAIRKMVCRYNLSDYVIFYGTSNAVERLFMCMDVFVLPSNFEGLPIVGVEAQAAGLPVIFSTEITKSAKLTDSVKYLSIGDDDIEKWSEGISSFKDYDRHDTYSELKEKGFDLKNTVNSLQTLYKA